MLLFSNETFITYCVCNLRCWLGFIDLNLGLASFFWNKYSFPLKTMYLFFHLFSCNSLCTLKNAEIIKYKESFASSSLLASTSKYNRESPKIVSFGTTTLSTCNKYSWYPARLLVLHVPLATPSFAPAVPDQLRPSCLM